MKRKWVIAYGCLVGIALVATAVGTYFRYEPTRDTVIKQQKVVDSACARAITTGDHADERECDRIRIDSLTLRAACATTRKAGLGCPAAHKRPDVEQPRSTQQSNGGDPNGPDPQEPAPGSPPADAPDPPDPGPSSSGGSSGGEASGSGDDTTPTPPPQTPPTPPPTDPSDPPGTSTPGLLDPLTDPTCQITTQLNLPICL